LQMKSPREEAGQNGEREWRAGGKKPANFWAGERGKERGTTARKTGSRKQQRSIKFRVNRKERLKDKLKSMGVNDLGGRAHYIRGEWGKGGEAGRG